MEWHTKMDRMNDSKLAELGHKSLAKWMIENAPNDKIKPPKEPCKKCPRYPTVEPI